MELQSQKVYGIWVEKVTLRRKVPHLMKEIMHKLMDGWVKDF